MLATLLITWLSVLSLARIEALTVDCSAEKPVISINNLPLELTHQGTIIKYEQVQIARLLNSTNVGMPRKYIAAKLDAGNLLIYTSTDFVYYARDQIATSITLELNFTCAEAERGNRTLLFKQPILARNYYAPVFTKSLYELLLPTPIFAGFELTTLTEVAARDNDLTQNRIVFSAVNITQHVVSVSTKADTDALGKVYFASLRLERMYLRLEKRIEFTLCATDNGTPKRNATARVIIREDSKRRLPVMPRFEQSYYHATLERDLTLRPLRVHLTRGSYTNGIRFQLNETDSALFNISTPIISAVDVRLAQALDMKPLRNRSCLHFTIIAEHRDMDGIFDLCVAKTVVLIEVPKLEAYFHFLKPIYEGYIDSNGLLSMDSITFSPLGYSAHVKFALNGTKADAFKLYQKKNQLKLELANHKLLDDVTNQSFIRLDLVAAANLLELHAISNVLIKLPAWRKSGDVALLQPEFEQTLYRGAIVNDTGVLRLEPIVFNATTFRLFKTELSLTGDQHKNFDFILMDNSVKLQMLARPKGNLANGTLLLLTLAAQNGKLRGHTTIALTLIRHANASEAGNRAIFERRWLVGKILGVNATQLLDLAPIVLSGVKSAASYVFILSGDEANHFGVVVDQFARRLTLKLEKPLGNVQPSNRTELVLQLQAEHRDQPDFKSIIVIFLQLQRRDCLQQINALLPSAPRFSSDAYIFTVKPNVMGSLGYVSAMRPGHNASIRYTLTVNDPELRKRISINALTGELSLLSYVTPGIYYFTITAQESLSLAQTSAQVRLNVETIFKCYRDEQPEVADAVIVKYIEEGRAYTQLLNVRLDEFCALVIRDVTPSDNAEYVYIDNATHMLATKAIDRESSTFRGMAAPQLRVRLSMECVGEAVAMPYIQMAPQSFNESFVEDIPYSKDTTLVRLFIVDVNDNAPQFVQPNNLSTLGYPAPSARAELFPEYLVRVRATDADEGKNAEILFSLPANEHFEIDATSGIIYPKATALLYDSHVNLVVQATDAGGLSNQLNLMVQRLEDDYYTMLTIVDNGRSGRLPRILAALSNNTGFDITVVRQAVLPRVSRAHLPRDAGKGNQSSQLLHKVWVYAFDNNEPISTKELQAELAIDMNLFENQSLALQSFAEVLSERNQREDAFGYILTIGFLALISTTCIIFLIYTFDCCCCCCRTKQRLHKAYDLNAGSIKDELRMDEVCGVVSPMSTLPPSLTRPVRNICHCASCERVNQIVVDGSLVGQRETTDSLKLLLVYLNDRYGLNE